MENRYIFCISKSSLAWRSIGHVFISAILQVIPFVFMIYRYDPEGWIEKTKGILSPIWPYLILPIVAYIIGFTLMVRYKIIFDMDNGIYYSGVVRKGFFARAKLSGYELSSKNKNSSIRILGPDGKTIFTLTRDFQPRDILLSVLEQFFSKTAKCK